MNYDNFEEVINGPETYARIAEIINRDGSVLIGWTDGDMTHLDILFTSGVTGFGHFQGGVNPSDIFVSIMRKGAFGFESNSADTHAGYYNEKLGGGMGSTAEKLAELINEVKKLLV